MLYCGYIIITTVIKSISEIKGRLSYFKVLRAQTGTAGC